MKILTALFLSYHASSTIVRIEVSNKEDIKTSPCSEKSNEFSLDNLYYADILNNDEDYNYELDNYSEIDNFNWNSVIDSSTKIFHEQCHEDEFIFQNNMGVKKRNEDFSKIFLEESCDSLIFINDKFFDI